MFSVAIYELAGLNGKPRLLAWIKHLTSAIAMSERHIWISAGVIVAEFGDRTSDYIIDQLSDVLADSVAVKNWRRVAVAVDAIVDAKRKQCS
jgi:hypothetical protein